MARRRLVKHERSPGSQPELDVGVIHRAELNTDLVEKVYLLLIVPRVIESLLPFDPAVASYIPPLAIRVVECQANPIDFEVVDTLMLLSPHSIVLATLRIFREVLLLSQRINLVFKLINRRMLEVLHLNRNFCLILFNIDVKLCGNESSILVEGLVDLILYRVVVNDF